MGCLWPSCRYHWHLLVHSIDANVLGCQYCKTMASAHLSYTPYAFRDFGDMVYIVYAHNAFGLIGNRQLHQ